jgi:parvulin-like peptidyl-prolyl isomerase
MMRLTAIILSLALIVLVACGTGSDEGAVKLQKESPDYALAVELAEKVPALNPDENEALVTSDEFTITAGYVIQNMSASMGKGIEQLKSLDPERLKSVIRSNAERFGEKMMLLNLADKAGITVTPEEVDSLKNLQYMRMGGIEKFEEFVASRGITMEMIDKDMAEGMKIQKYLDGEIESRTQISDDDLKAAFDQDRTASVRHILMLTQGKSDEEKKEIYAKMEGVLAEARSGKDFAALANKYSEDTGSNKKGGLYENFGRGQMVKPFEDAAFSVPVGEISDIVETTYGYHILKIEDRKRDDRTFEEFAASERDRMKQTKQREVYNELMEASKKAINFTVADF